MKVGDLVRFIGVDQFYEGRTGTVCSLYNTRGYIRHDLENNNCALVYFPGAEKTGRAQSGSADRSRVTQTPTKSGLHPMGLSELEVISVQV